ncbi:glycosyltransferase [Legionella moravica]|uniref:Glycosyltransferase n=1 Tax=Legionella moravica TaxID=39962 RepID=A0A378JYW0_9GAMM|nr:glycosyltransferase [Legionella moravica]STX62662.1 glycosyltransferase [Legionella moravica]
MERDGYPSNLNDSANLTHPWVQLLKNRRHSPSVFCSSRVFLHGYSTYHRKSLYRVCSSYVLFFKNIGACLSFFITNRTQVMFYGFAQLSRNFFANDSDFYKKQRITND